MRDTRMTKSSHTLIPHSSSHLLTYLPSLALFSPHFLLLLTPLCTSETFLDLHGSKHLVACSKSPKDHREDLRVFMGAWWRRTDITQVTTTFLNVYENALQYFYICPRIRPIGDARVNWASPSQWHEWLCQWTRRFLFTVFALLTL